MLSLVTIGFGVDFWAWALLSPLGAATTPRHRPLSATWQAAALYSVAIGGYVAFSVTCRSVRVHRGQQPAPADFIPYGRRSPVNQAGVAIVEEC